MDGIVAPTRHTRHLVARQGIADGCMNRVALERAGSQVAVKALTIVEWTIEFDLVRIWRISQILDIDVPESAKFGVKTAVEGIVRMAGVTRLIHGNQVILKVRSRQVRRIVDVEALPVRLHDVATKAEGRLLGTSDVFRRSPQYAQRRKNQESYEREHFPFTAVGDARAKDYQRDQRRTDHQQRVKQQFG
jgi:hypothetical protein